MHALLGPNGAGKSTAVHTFATLTRIDEGEARVAGFDVRTQHAQVRAAIGLVGQSAALDEILHGRENLVMFGRLHGLATAAARARAAELLEALDLADAARPQGLDLLRRHAAPPRHRRRPHHPARGALPRRADDRASTRAAGPTSGRPYAAWSALGTTVLLTTQYLDEADQLADRITVMDAGRVIAEGTPGRAEGTPRRRPGARRPADRARRGRRRAAVATGRGGDVRLDAERARGRRRGRARGRHRRPARRRPRPRRRRRSRPTHVQLREPTLDEVFLHLTDRPTATDATDGGHR